MTYNPKIAAIPTEFRGIQFRSRLEARWAVYFDLMGIEWRYEPTVPVLFDGTHYQPDFVINKGELEWPEVDSMAYVEVKPRSLAFVDFAALAQPMRELCAKTDSPVLLLVGSPDNCEVLQFTCYHNETAGCRTTEMSFGNQPSVYGWDPEKENTACPWRSRECANAAAKHRFPVR